MRLRALSISGFRGFPTTCDFDLEADAVILVGANGSGKTSFFDAILWALVGTVPRLGEEPHAVVNRWSPSGDARVELSLRTPLGSTVTVVRRYDGAMSLSVDVDAEPLRGPTAEARLLDELWPDAQLASEPWEALGRAMTRGVYLQQDLLREFIEADAEQDRFNVIGEIIGAGRVGELQRQLESGKAAWTRATNMLVAEGEPLRARRAAVAERLSRLSETSLHSENLPNEWQQWLQGVQAFVEAPEVAADAPGAARALDSTLKQLEARELQISRRIATVERLRQHLEAAPPTAEPIAPLRETLASADRVLTEHRSQLQAVQERAATERARLIRLTEEKEELRALAELAIRHLGEHCPVCEQRYDIEATRRRLESLSSAPASGDPSVATQELEALSVAVAKDERLLTEATARLREAERSHSIRQEWETTLEQLLSSEPDLNDEGDLSALAANLDQTLREERAALAELRRRGDSFALRLARGAELSQRAELERELARLDAELDAQGFELSARKATGELAASLLGALRDAGSDLVADELARIEPLLQRIYAAVDPHPAFRAVRFLTRTVRGRGRLWTSLDDLTTNVSVEQPATVLSSSQLNVLAVSVFLALNLGVETLPLDVLALDDPLQSLDDVNLLGLVDLLRRIKGQRQLILSTHDPRFGALLARKLRPVSSDQSVRLIEFTGWSREGPIVESRLVHVDPRPLRLVA